MQNPRGCNDRLNENGDRQNDKRLFNSENNARGGYCWGPELSFYEGKCCSNNIFMMVDIIFIYVSLTLGLSYD